MLRSLPLGTPRGPSWYNLHMPVVRMEQYLGDPPFAPPPYSSIMKDVRDQIFLFKKDEMLRAKALFPVRLKAGQSKFSNGQIGRSFSPSDIPEFHNGKIFYNQA